MKRNSTPHQSRFTHLRHALLGGLVVLALSLLARAEVAKHAVDIVPTEPGTSDQIEPKSVAVVSDGTHLTLVFDAGQDIRDRGASRERERIRQAVFSLERIAR